MKSLGIRIEKQAKEKWPTVRWAVVEKDAAGKRVTNKAELTPPRNYDVSQALTFVYEKVADVVKDNGAQRVCIWGIESNARLNTFMKPRLRTEGAALAAACSAGAVARIAEWKSISADAGADCAKDDYDGAAMVCGVSALGADSLAVLAALAELGTG